MRRGARLGLIMSHLSYAAAAQPVLNDSLEHRDRHGRRRETDIVKVANVEPGTEPLARLCPQAEPAGLANFIAAGLSRPSAVALHLGGHGAALFAGGRHHVVDRLLAAPVLDMQSGIDD